MQLRRRRNASLPLPINRLPPELLRMIFGHLRKPPSTRRTRHLYGVRFSPYTPLISVMLVCHKWCTIASHAASLWTDIGLSATELLISRSLGASIRLSGCLSPEDDPLETIFKDNGARIRELDLWAVGPMPALPSILETHMPRLHTIALFSEDKFSSTVPSQLLINVPVSFPALKAMMLENILIIPTHVLPQLTHLHLGRMKGLSVSDILDVLRNTPALEVLDISPPEASIHPSRSTGAASSPVALHHLRDLYVRNLTFTIVHHLVTVLDVPTLAFLHMYSPFGSDGTIVPTKLLPKAVTMWKVNRLAVDLKYALLSVAFRGDHVSLDVETTFNLVQEEKWNWLHNDFPTMLSLSGVGELHFQTRLWDVPVSENLLSLLAPYMPAVSTLIIKHDAGRFGNDDDDPEGVICLGRAVAGILASDRPVLFPNVVHLELIVSDIPVELCQCISDGLARRAEAGRRLQKLRIRVDESHSFRWKMKWLHEQEPEWEETGIFDHVDSGEIFQKRRGYMRYDDYDDDTARLGWGKWKDCVQSAQHDYWEE